MCPRGIKIIGRRRDNSGYVVQMFSPLAHDRASKQEKSSRCSESSEGAGARGLGGAGGLSAQPVFAAAAGAGGLPLPRAAAAATVGCATLLVQLDCRNEREKKCKCCQPSWQE